MDQAPSAAPNRAPVVTRKTAGLILLVAVLTALAELAMGRSLLGPDGRFGLWEGNIWSREISQRAADPYSCSHFVHGILFYLLLWLAARRMPLERRLLLAVVIEAAWELLENSPIIINRYRATTISADYSGDSVLNSLCDLGFMSAGFLLASGVRPWVSLGVVLILEVGCALWVRDNLTLNVIMLACPFEGIKAWQLAGRP